MTAVSFDPYRTLTNVGWGGKFIVIRASYNVVSNHFSDTIPPHATEFTEHMVPHWLLFMDVFIPTNWPGLISQKQGLEGTITFSSNSDGINPPAYGGSAAFFHGFKRDSDAETDIKDMPTRWPGMFTPAGLAGVQSDITAGMSGNATIDPESKWITSTRGSLRIENVWTFNVDEIDSELGEDQIEFRLSASLDGTQNSPLVDVAAGMYQAPKQGDKGDVAKYGTVTDIASGTHNIGESGDVLGIVYHRTVIGNSPRVEIIERVHG